METSPAVEARSLSSITELASHPPRYPRNPTDQRRPPLVLYIARVPGSQDVILTTMKPGLKNLTAEDVASSLYYLHRDIQSEDDFRREAPDIENSGTSNTQPRGAVVPRKPVPAEHTHDIPRKPVDSRSFTNDAHVAPNRSIERTAINKPLRPVDMNAERIRRPLGPRPMSNQSRDTPSLAGEENASEWNTSEAPSLDSSFRLRLPERPKFQSNGNPPQRVVEHYQPPKPFPVEVANARPEFTPISITLIRRDPTTAAQWNIGKIVGQSISSMGTNSYLDKSNILSTTHLTTPGYSQFYGTEIAQSVCSGAHPMPEIITFSGVQRAFNRHVFAELSNSVDRSFMPRRRGTSDPGKWKDSTFSDFDNLENSDHSPSKSNKSRLKSYAFYSPWNGRCEMTTGNGGRVLKCKHTLPDNAAVPDTNPTYSGPSTTVSELRFNLPTSSLFKGTLVSPGSKDTGRSKRPTLSHIRNKLSSELSRNSISTPHPTSYAAMYPSDDEDNDSDESEDGRFGLSLGQEKAGGGNRGKRTKLGKLIIYDEGMKMLDLIVAANMGVWWSIWEK